MSIRWIQILVFTLVLTVVVRQFATDICEDDAFLMLQAMVSGKSFIAPWYHAAYLAIASVLSAPFGHGSESEALLWTSALCSAVGAALVFVAFPRGDSRAWLATVALVISPGWILNATRIELHGCQLMGAALLLAVAVRGVPGRSWRTALLFTFAVAGAVLCHRSNIGLLPGAVWIASAGRGRSIWKVNAVAALVGGALATWLNALGEPLGSVVLQGRTWAVVLFFWRGFSLEFIWDEVLLLWFPVLLVPFLVRTTEPRRRLPIAAAVVPSLVFFSMFGVRTMGGYFAGMAPFSAAAAVRDGTAAPAWRWRSWRGAVIAVAAVLGVYVAHLELNGERRTTLELAVDMRLQAIDVALPNGGILFSVDGTEQTMDGRRPRVYEVELFPQLMVRHQRSGDFEGVGTRLFSEAKEFHDEGLVVALDVAWYAWPDLSPLIEMYLGDLVRLFREQPGVYPVETILGTFLVWPPDVASN